MDGLLLILLTDKRFNSNSMLRKNILPEVLSRSSLLTNILCHLASHFCQCDLHRVESYPKSRPRAVLMYFHSMLQFHSLVLTANMPEN